MMREKASLKTSAFFELAGLFRLKAPQFSHLGISVPPPSRPSTSADLPSRWLTAAPSRPVGERTHHTQGGQGRAGRRAGERQICIRQGSNRGLGTGRRKGGEMHMHVCVACGTCVAVTVREMGCVGAGMGCL